MHEPIGALQRLVLDRSSVLHSTPAPETLQLSKLTDQDDIEAYLLTFEQMMQAHHIDPAQWVFHLAPQLTRKAQQAYAALSTDESDMYDSVKKAILGRYNINEETYRRQFRGAKLRKGELPQSSRHASRISPEGGRRSVLQSMSYWTSSFMSNSSTPSPRTSDYGSGRENPKPALKQVH